MRIKKIWVTIILICCSILLFVACEESRVATSISLNEYSSENPLEFAMGNFTYSDYTVSIRYNNGAKEEIALKEDMISETDKLKFYQEGRNTITVAYRGAKTSIEINVFRNQFSENIYLKDFTATYNGDSFTVEVEGDIPGGTKILYPQGNTFKNAGNYDITAILQRDGYVTKKLSARVVINKATYDVSNAQLYKASVVYNKDSHQLAVKGKLVEKDGVFVHSPATLPQGVTVSYSITKVKDGNGVDIPVEKQQTEKDNKAVEAGTYRVQAIFKGDEKNYESILPSEEVLVIERATYDLSKVAFVDKTVTYTGEMQALSIAEDSKLPSDVQVSYQIKQLKNAVGKEVVDATYKSGNSAIKAGVYVVKASFGVSGRYAENYTTNPLEKEAYLTIRRASYDEEMKDAYLDMQWAEFVENKTYEMNFDYELPKGVTPRFTITNASGQTISGEMKKVTSEIKGDGEAVKTVYKYLFSVETEGEYNCVVTFVHDNENYAPITIVLSTTFYISKVA